MKTRTSFVFRKNKVVVFLTTNPDLANMNSTDGTMPLVIEHYNGNKCGVVILHKVTKEVSYSKPTKRWPNVVF